MNIRVFRTQDQEQVVLLWKACSLISTLNNPIQDIQRKLKVDPELFLVGEIDSQIIASVMGGYEGHRGWINYLAVHPDYRCKGYGFQVMQHVEGLLKAKGCPKINLQVRATNSEVIAFYKKIGFSDDRVISLGKRLTNDEPFSM